MLVFRVKLDFLSLLSDFFLIQKMRLKINVEVMRRSVLRHSASRLPWNAFSHPTIEPYPATVDIAIRVEERIMDYHIPSSLQVRSSLGLRLTRPSMHCGTWSYTRTNQKAVGPDYTHWFKKRHLKSHELTKISPS